MSRASALDQDELSYLSLIDRQVQEDLELYSWWQQADATRSYAEYFPLVPDVHGLGGVNGFFDTVRIGGRIVPVMGVIQEIFYDQPRMPAAPPGQQRQAAEWIRQQVKEFALRYYMRVEKHAYNLGSAATSQQTGSWAGFNNQQIYYKLRNGEIGKFPEHERWAIVDLRDIGPVYEWVLLQMGIFDFDWSWTLGASAQRWPTLQVYLNQVLHLVLVPDLISNQENPESGILGRYGPGVAFLKKRGDPGILAYGPDEIQPAFEQARFEVYENGQIRVRIPWVTNQPTKILNIPLNPLRLGLDLANSVTGGAGNRLLGMLPDAFRRLAGPSPGFDPVMGFIPVANLLTGGWAADELCISRRRLDQEMLFLHSAENYRTVVNTLPVWKQVPDWLDANRIPAWIKRGKAITEDILDAQSFFRQG